MEITYIWGRHTDILVTGWVFVYPSRGTFNASDIRSLWDFEFSNKFFCFVTFKVNTCALDSTWLNIFAPLESFTKITRKSFVYLLTYLHTYLGILQKKNSSFETSLLAAEFMKKKQKIYSNNSFSRNQICESNHGRHFTMILCAIRV